MKKRMLALVMTLVMMLNCFGGVTAFAVNADRYDVTHDSSWTELTQSNISSYGSSISGHWYFNQGGEVLFGVGYCPEYHSLCLPWGYDEP